MIVETGHYALWLAGAIALLQALLPTFCADRRIACAIAVSAAKTQCVLPSSAVIWKKSGHSMPPRSAAPFSR